MLKVCCLLAASFKAVCVDNACEPVCVNFVSLTSAVPSPASFETADCFLICGGATSTFAAEF